MRRPQTAAKKDFHCNPGYNFRHFVLTRHVSSLKKAN
ncbi:hypothetical protein FIC_00202 [Flavobacteriaceae bacterium 3519-10]|nr:hypothetical protein FIC_00202 [Flavobacteriaceae bacterium 3519-10]